MTIHQPHLGDTRHQELRNSPFWPSSLFKSQLVKEGEEFSSKKAPLKMLRVLDPIKISPFLVPTIRKEAPTGNAPMGATPHKAVTNRFPQVGKTEFQGLQGSLFDPTLGDEGMETPPPNDSSKASLSPPVGGRLQLPMFKQHYHQWICSDIHFKTKSCQGSSDSVRIQVPSKRTSSGHL